MEQVIGACGCICSDCRIYDKECQGCYVIEGKPCWLPEVGLDICDFYECAVMDNGFHHCGECAQIPCEKFWKNKNPKWTDEEHREIIFERVQLLKDLHLEKRMRKMDFELIKKASELFKFTSLEHSEYDDIADYHLLQNDENGIFMVGWNKEKQLSEIHWAANHVEYLTARIADAPKPLVITFIPEEWVESLKKEGFEIFGIWNDYFKESIVTEESLPYSETLSEEDAQEISQVTLSCRGTSRGFTGQSTSFCRDWMVDQPKSKDGLKNKAIIGYHSDNQLIGCVFVAVYGENKTLWIREIVVSPEYQGKGIGRKLLRQAFAYALERGARRSFLAADECNENAIHLYQSLGYVANPKDRQIDMILEN